MTEAEEIKARIEKKKVELAELEQGIKEVFAEDFLDKFRMDIANFKKSIERDEKLLKELQNG